MYPASCANRGTHRLSAARSLITNRIWKQRQPSLAAQGIADETLREPVAARLIEGREIQGERALASLIFFDAPE